MNKLGIANRKYPILWSSTEYSSTVAWIQLFVDGNQYDYYKTYSTWTQAIRKVKK